MRSLRARVLVALFVVVGSFGVALGLNALELARIGGSLELVNEVYLPLAALASRLGAEVERGDIRPLLVDARTIIAGARTEDPEERAALNAALRQVDEVETAWLTVVNAQATPSAAREEILQLGTLADSRITAVSDKTARAQSSAVRTAFASSLVAAVVAALVLIVARRVLQPVDQLTDAVRQMTAGKPLPVLNTAGDDEIATLARAVGSMAQAVAERDAERERRLRSERLALVGQMLAQVTHEVRNPLNALSLNVELLLEDVRAAEFPGRVGVEEVARGVMGEIRRLEAVTERYLDLARRPPAMLAPEDPVGLARSVLLVEEEALRRSGVEAEVWVDPAKDPTGCVVEMDGGVVRRALLNLLQNAAQAGARHIVVRVGAERRVAVFSVEDDGPGVPEESQAHLFEPFFTTRAQGTGLGLAVARQSIEDIGGTLIYRASKGGSVFEIRVGTGPTAATAPLPSR